MHPIREPAAYRFVIGNGNRARGGIGLGGLTALSSSQPASCLLLGIPQLGSVPWAQPLLSCPHQMQMPAQLRIWAKPDAAMPPVSWEVMENPYQMPKDGSGTEKHS